MFRRYAALTVTCALFAVASGARVEGQRSGGVKLVVVLVADQMRSDYLDRLGEGSDGGLRRIMREGAMFPDAAYTYLNTVTCPGHATVGTGALPYRHGLILNEWYDRKAGALQPCTKDESATLVSYGGFTGTSDSPKHLLVPTLSDQIRERTKGGRVVTMSIKPRSSIALAGHKADSAVWFDDRGAWATSSYYTKQPVPFVESFVAANPIGADVQKVWDRMLDASRYQHADDAAGERPQTGWTRTFPHPLAREGKADAGYLTRWKASPFADEYLGRMAAAAVDAFNLGRGEGIDFLGVSFSTLDTVGHAFGPNSHEVQDIVARLDLTIGRLLDHLDRTVGRERYVVAFSSDHGVAPIPEQSGGGRQAGKEIVAAVNAALVPLLGPGQHATTNAYTDVYLAPGVAERLKRDAKARAAALDAARSLPGITQAFMADELDSREARTSSDPVKRAAALGYHKGRSGDLIVVPRENWILSTAATTHGTFHGYDTRVPVMFYGAGVPAGRFDAVASPADVAPTLAALARVRFDTMDGRVLMDAVGRRTTDAGR